MHNIIFKEGGWSIIELLSYKVAKLHFLTGLGAVRMKKHECVRRYRIIGAVCQSTHHQRFILKTKTVSFLLASAIALLFSVTLQANAGTSSGTITSIFPIASGQVFVTTSAVASQPACAVYGWALDLNAAGAGGKAMLAALMLAQASGKTVYITGSGTCTVWADRENIVGVNVQS